MNFFWHVFGAVICGGERGRPAAWLLARINQKLRFCCPRSSPPNPREFSLLPSPAVSEPRPAVGNLKPWRRERDSNPRSALRRTPDFESGPFNHSGISPWVDFQSFFQVLVRLRRTERGRPTAWLLARINQKLCFCCPCSSPPNPRSALRRTPDFESGPFNHSGISP